MIVVVGPTSSGKSTLVNALLGRALMPAGVQETTRCPVIIDVAARDGVRALSIGGDTRLAHDDPALRAALREAFSAERPSLLRLEVATVRDAAFRVPWVRLLPRRRRPAFVVDLPGLVHSTSAPTRTGELHASPTVALVVLSAEDTDPTRDAAVLSAAPRGVPAIVALNKVDAFDRDGDSGARRGSFIAERTQVVRAALGASTPVLPVCAIAALCAELLTGGSTFASAADIDDAAFSVPRTLWTRGEREALDSAPPSSWSREARGSAGMRLRGASGFTALLSALQAATTAAASCRHLPATRGRSTSGR